MYLVLRSRLDTVKNWVDLGVTVMREARQAKGLSYEAVGRLANVSSKTYERYEKAGRVPGHELVMFASILGLEVSQPTPRPATVTAPEGPVTLADIDARLRSLEARVAELPTGDQLVHGLELLRRAIDAQATAGTRAV